MTEPAITEHIELQSDAGWLTVWLNRPASRNALSTEMIDELSVALNFVRNDRGVRGITIRGRGSVFCAGGDIKDFRALFQGDLMNMAEVAAANRRAGALFGLINETPQVVVMLVEGAAIAGGLGMLCAADVVVATRTAQFALTETTLGIPPAQIAPFVAQRIGLAAARRIMLTAARFDALQAQAIGLVDEVAEDAGGLAAIEKRIRGQVYSCAPGANAVTKEILLAAGRLEGAVMRQFAAERFAACMLGEEGREGVAAFIEKRSPDWTR